MSNLKVNSIQSRSGSGTLTLGSADDVISMTGSKVRLREDWTIVNANTTLAVGQNYAANTRAGAHTLTLPASATIGDTISIIDHHGLASSNNITIATNGNSIDGFNRNAVLNVNRGGISLVYISSDVGWMSDKRQQETQVHRFQGEVSGYVSGDAGTGTAIEKFSFVTDSNATSVGTLTQGREQPAGQSSSISGYTSAGYVGPSGTNTIDKFPFATDTNASDVGDVTQARYGTPAGQSSDINGYTSGGLGGAPEVEVNTIDKFPFAVDTNASDVGDLTQARRAGGGNSSDINGYTNGGEGPAPVGFVNTVDKFPFATDTNASDVGDLTQARGQAAGQSSETFGYSSGGDSPPQSNVIDKFPFATDSNATDVGDLTQARRLASGQSSTVSGYTSGGFTTPPPTNQDTIDKFIFASDADATDVGNLGSGRRASAGQQV